MPASPASAPHPSPGQLTDAAQELRACARQLRTLVLHGGSGLPAYESVLKDVIGLNKVGLGDGDTWYGQYPDQVASQINGWEGKIRAGTQSLLALATSWDKLAVSFEQQAGAAHAAAVKAQHHPASNAAASNNAA